MRYQDRLDPDHLRRYASALNARARSQQMTDAIDAATLQDVILASGGRCGWCGTSVIDADFEIDHIISLRTGGANRRDNLALACPTCNRRKSDRHPAAFAQEMAARGPEITPLVRHVLDHYGMPPQKQLDLFGDTSPDDDPASHNSQDTDDPPPYRWGERAP